MKFKCYEKRTIEIPDCKETNPNDCNRTFHLYLPSIICGNKQIINEDGTDIIQDTNGDEYTPDLQSIGNLPLVFGIHCYGCTAQNIDVFAQYTDTLNMVLVLPEGIQSSFNGKHCCGYALENNIDDVGYFKHLQTMLSDEYSFIKGEYSYGVGWSNGGFMVMHAADLFRSLAPISGNIYDIDPSLTKGGKPFCVDGICIDTPSDGKGLFLHHGADDNNVQPTGCCTDPDSPKCCCNIAAEGTCVSVMEVAKNWALEVNGCEMIAEKDGNDSETIDAEEEGDEKDDSGDNERRMKTDVTDVAFATSYTDSDKGIECLTATGADCKSNTTICIHEHAGHFNRPSFNDAFPFSKEVILFFARDACGINNGVWNETSDTCLCPEKYAGTYCLDEKDEIETIVNDQPEKTTLTIHQVENDYEVDLEDTSSSSKRSHTIGYTLFVLALLYVVRKRYQRDKKKNDSGYSHVMDRDIEATEMTVSRGFRTN